MRREEIDNCSVDTTRGKEISSAEMSRGKSEAGLRARYARSFPRAADRRLASYRFEDGGDEEVGQADGTEQDKVIPC